MRTHFTAIAFRASTSALEVLANACMLRVQRLPYSHIQCRIGDLRTHTDHMTQLDAREFLQHHIGKLRDAHQLFAGYGIPVNMINLECLSLYENLFACMHQHSRIWNVFFENIKNTVWCERSVAIGNTFATFLRQRAEHFRESKDEQAFQALSHCERVLNLGGKLIKRYKHSMTNPDFFGSRSFKQCCRFPP